MVTMKNIRLENNYIAVDCYKEGQEEGYFSLLIDVRSYEIVKSSLGRPSVYARQAALKIAELHKQNADLPAEAISVWC